MFNNLCGFVGDQPIQNEDIALEAGDVSLQGVEVCAAAVDQLLSAETSC
jgi:hypothetical protein